MADKSYKLTLSLSDGSTINAGTITAPQGPNGANGVTFTPSVSAAGVISWTNNGGLTNPSPISIKGPKGDDAVITESDVEGWGFTRNVGTITEIKMNGASKGTSGVVDLGAVFTAHTGLVGGNLVQYDSTGQTLKDSGKKISDLATTSQVNAKYTKPSGGIPKTDLASDVQTSLEKADNAMPKKGGTFTGEVTFGSTENFQGYYIKRMIGSLSAGTEYKNLDSSYKDGTWHRLWRLRFPSGKSFWGKIKITLYGGYSSFNASGVMSKSITCNFNTSNLYNNVGCYDGLGVNVEQDFRISEVIWNATVSAWEVLIWQKNLKGNNSPTIMLECWTTNNTNYIKAFNGITAQTVELTQSTSYSAQKASPTGGTKTVTWATLPVYENPLGEEIATNGGIEKKLQNYQYEGPTLRNILFNSEKWVSKTWSGLTSFYGSSIWTDGDNIYYSSGSTQYVLNKATSTWSRKTWSGLTNFTVVGIWTDGDNIYHSSGSSHYVLNKATSTWSTKTWSGLTSSTFYPYDIWTDGDNIYYSHGSTQYVLNKATSTWSAKTWSGLTNFNGNYVWTDGDNIYYSYNSSTQYVLNKATSTWSAKTWSGTALFGGDYIWTDGDNIYYSGTSEASQYILNKATSTWSKKTWSGGYKYMGGDNVWTDGDNIYYSSGSNQYVLNKVKSHVRAKPSFN